LTLAKKFNKNEHPYWVQIFGTDPKNMAIAAKIIEQEIKPTGLDINLGCPVPKARKGGYGAIQLENISAVVEIIKEVKKNISLPLSLKTRLGLKEPTEILNFAPRLVEAGLDQLVVHARTLQGMFSEEPNWQIIKELNQTLPIPIVYNGGIKTSADAKFYSEKTDCKNLIIGQASIGNPWIFS
jgi:tRNA-dihydrouridine synthase B